MAALLAAAVFYGLMLQGCASTESARLLSDAAAPEGISAREPIVLVCPIDTVSTKGDISGLSHVLAPIIRRDLFCIQRISVIPTEGTNVPIKAFFLGNKGLRELARAHGADMVTVGYLHGGSEEIAIDFAAYDVMNNAFILKTKIEGKASRIFKLEREVIFRFSEALQVDLSKRERDRLTSCSPKEFEAATKCGQGLIDERGQKYADALVAYEEAAKADKCFAIPYVAEARIFRKYDAPSRAMKLLEMAVERDEFFAEAWYQLSQYATHYDQKPDLAAEYCRRALEIAPRFGIARRSLGARLHALGDLDQAIEETKKAVALLPVDPLSRHNLGVCYRDNGKPEEARKWFQEALRLNPDFEAARVELEKLGGE